MSSGIDDPFRYFGRQVASSRMDTLRSDWRRQGVTDG
jgi:hypothetical protein